MNDRYAGDIGDFGKYGLLRWLCGVTGVHEKARLKLGVVWYLTPNDGTGPRKGIHSYLYQRPDLCHLDSSLDASLRTVVERGPATVRKIEEAGICPPDTLYFDDCVPTDSHTGSPAQRSRERQSWAERALKLMTDCDLVFLDPDNGIVTDQKVHPRSKQGGKYVFLDELRPYVAREQSLLVYHHTGRNSSAEDQTMRLVARLQIELGLVTRPMVLRFHRGTSRSYVVIPSREHFKAVATKVAEFLALWKPHFTSALGDG